METIDLSNSKIGDMFKTERGTIVSLVSITRDGRGNLYRCKCSDYPDDLDDLTYSEFGEVRFAPCTKCHDMNITEILTPRKYKAETRWVGHWTDIKTRMPRDGEDVLLLLMDGRVIRTLWSDLADKTARASLLFLQGSYPRYWIYARDFEQ